MRRRAITLSLATLLGAPVVTGVLSRRALAASEAPFTQVAFERAQADGGPILVHVNADWCPTCARQRPILESLAADPAFRDLRVFKVDFDNQKGVLRTMGVQMQSTLIVFHGRDERGRSTGQTDPEAIRALLNKSKA